MTEIPNIQAWRYKPLSDEIQNRKKSQCEVHILFSQKLLQ